MTERKRAVLDLGPDDDGAGGADLHISGFAPKAAPGPEDGQGLSEASG